MMQVDVTPAALRAAAKDALRGPGQRRIRAVTEVEAADEELLPLVLAAIRNEVPIGEIATMTAYAPNTIRALVKRHEQEG